MSYPILYDRFTVPNFNSNGLGVLSEAVSCTVKEERNGSYELEMQYPVKGVLFKSLLARRMILAKHDKTDDAQVFDIYSVSKPTQGMVTVRAKHMSGRLANVALKPFTAVGLTPKMWFEDLNDPNFSEVVGGRGLLDPWVFSSDCDSGYLDTSITLDTYSNLFDVMMQENGPILGRKPIASNNTIYYEGYGENAFDYRFGYFTVEVLEDRGQVKDIVLRRDKNVRLLTENFDDIESLYGVVPYWRGRDIDGNEVFVDLTQYSSPDVIEGMILSGVVDASRVEIKDFSSVWEQQPTTSELYRAGVDYMDIVNTNNSNNISYVVDLAPSDTSRQDLQTIQLCDTITIQDDLLGISKQLKVVSLTYDVLKDEVTEIQLGRQYPKLSTEMKRVNDIWVKSAETTQNEETDASAESKKRITSVTNHVAPTRATSSTVEKIATIHQKERDGSTTDFPVYAHSGGGGDTGAMVLRCKTGEWTGTAVTNWLCCIGSSRSFKDLKEFLVGEGINGQGYFDLVIPNFSEFPANKKAKLENVVIAGTVAYNWSQADHAYGVMPCDVWVEKLTDTTASVRLRPIQFLGHAPDINSVAFGVFNQTGTYDVTVNATVFSNYVS